jgi:hypothetical protein
MIVPSERESRYRQVYFKTPPIVRSSGVFICACLRLSVGVHAKSIASAAGH